MKYLRGLVSAIERLGGKIYKNSRVVRVHSGPGDGRGQDRSAGAIVVATNVPIHDNLTIHLRQAPFRTCAIGASITWDTVPRALHWDTADPYHYVRLKSADTPPGRKGHDILIVGGEDYRQGEADDAGERFLRLEEWTRQRFPIKKVEYRWSGLVMEPADRPDSMLWEKL